MLVCDCKSVLLRTFNMHFHSVESQKGQSDIISCVAGMRHTMRRSLNSCLLVMRICLKLYDSAEVFVIPAGLEKEEKT